MEAQVLPQVAVVQVALLLRRLPAQERFHESGRGGGIVRALLEVGKGGAEASHIGLGANPFVAIEIHAPARLTILGRAVTPAGAGSLLPGRPPRPHRARLRRGSASASRSCSPYRKGGETRTP